MRNITFIHLGRYKLAVVVAVAIVSLLGIFSQVGAQANDTARDGRLVTIHDRGEEKVILTHAQNIRDALADAQISVVAEDQVEPSLDETLTATNYTVNIYRARPVIVVDGMVRQKIMTAGQTSNEIARMANLDLKDEDKATLSTSDNIVADGASVMLTIDRATEFTLKLYGSAKTARTQAKTVGEMLDGKHITLGSKDTLSVDRDTPITPGMTVAIWRDGVQTVTVEEDIPMPVRQIYDADQPVDYKHIQKAGKVGKKQVTYEIDMQGGRELSRREIQSVPTTQPVEQVEVVGVKSTSPAENEVIAWNYFIAKGFSRNQTAGIMGNLMQEHGFRTDGDGIAQWTGSRLSGLLSRPNPRNILTQLDFLMYELNGSYSKVKANLLAASTVEQAVVVFQNQYERCGICAESKRIQFAYQILGRY